MSPVTFKQTGHQGASEVSVARESRFVFSCSSDLCWLSSTETDQEPCWDFLLSEQNQDLEENGTEKTEPDSDKDCLLFEFSSEPLLPCYHVQVSLTQGWVCKAAASLYAEHAQLIIKSKLWQLWWMITQMYGSHLNLEWLITVGQKRCNKSKYYRYDSLLCQNCLLKTSVFWK